jgi:hypothetical protein
MALQRAVRDGPARSIMLWLALAGTLSHIALDFTNSYGVHPFWPLYNGWVYGDAVFIVEPWLWVLGIPPLLLGPRSPVGRGLLGLALAAILVAAFTLGVVPRALAAALTLVALGWLAVMWRVPVTTRLTLAALAWVGFESVSFASSASARARGHARRTHGARRCRTHHGGGQPALFRCDRGGGERRALSRQSRHGRGIPRRA